jgi:hypothetical protein
MSLSWPCKCALSPHLLLQANASPFRMFSNWTNVEEIVFAGRVDIASDLVSRPPLERFKNDPVPSLADLYELFMIYDV